MRAFRLALASTVPLLALAACGDGDAPAKGSGGEQRAPATASASPQERVKAAGAALARTKGFHLEGTATDEDGLGRLEGDVRQDGSLRFSLRQGGSNIEIRSIRGKVYFKADRAFWQENGGGPTAKLFADKWVTGPADQLGGKEFARFKPSTLGYCLGRRTGTLEDAGKADVDGTPVTRIRDRGDKPGTSSGVLSIAAEGEPLPLRVEQSGKERAGGTRDPRCDSDGPDTTTKEDLVFSDFGADGPIETPRDVLDLEELQRQAAPDTAES